MVHDVDMSRDWGRLGPAVTAAYLSLGYGQGEFASAAGVSRSTTSRLENWTNGPAPSPKTQAGIERVLGWPPGTCAAIADGADAPPATGARTLTVARPAELDDPGVLDRLPEQIRDELESGGDLIGVDVIDLGPSESGAKIIAIVKRDAGAPPLDDADRRSLLAEWQAKRRQMWQQPPAAESGAR